MHRAIHVTFLMLVILVQTACAAVAEPRAPEDLIAYIQTAEKVEVRESWGEEAGECFTWSDYDRFIRSNRPAVVASGLKATPQFRKLVEMIKAMPKPEQDKLLGRARAAARPTWAMIGRISREGTTDAGRKAGLLLAGAITAAAEEMLAER